MRPWLPLIQVVGCVGCLLVFGWKCCQYVGGGRYVVAGMQWPRSLPHGHSCRLAWKGAVTSFSASWSQLHGRVCCSLHIWLEPQKIKFNSFGVHNEKTNINSHWLMETPWRINPLYAPKILVHDMARQKLVCMTKQPTLMRFQWTKSASSGLHALPHTCTIQTPIRTHFCSSGQHKQICRGIPSYVCM